MAGVSLSRTGTELSAAEDLPRLSAASATRRYRKSASRPRAETAHPTFASAAKVSFRGRARCRPHQQRMAGIRPSRRVLRGTPRDAQGSLPPFAAASSNGRPCAGSARQSRDPRTAGDRASRPWSRSGSTWETPPTLPVRPTVHARSGHLHELTCEAVNLKQISGSPRAGYPRAQWSSVWTTPSSGDGAEGSPRAASTVTGVAPEETAP